MSVIVDYFDNRDTIILYDKNKNSISLCCGKHTLRGEMLIASIQENQDLQLFALSTAIGCSSKSFSQNEMQNILKRNKRFFEDPAVIFEINNKISDIQGSVEKQIKQKNDQRGNYDVAASQTVKSSAGSMFFTLSMPIIKGGDKVSFIIEIVPECVDNSLRFSFECLELIDLKQQQIDNIINSCLNRIKVALPGVPILEK